MIDYNSTIYSILSGSTDVTNLTTNFYPIIIPENANLPAIIYERSYTNSWNKDYLSGSIVDIKVLVVSDYYFNGIDISNAVKTAFEEYNIKLLQGTEDYVSGTFVQILNFQARVQ